jgi:cytochrome c oxidase cbb3-type subunit 3
MTKCGDPLRHITALWLVAAFVAVLSGRASAQNLLHQQPAAPPGAEAKAPDIYNLGSAPTDVTAVEEDLGNGPDALLKVPVSGIHPGAVASLPVIPNPVDGDPKAVQRGMTYYNQFNCVGCHAPNGAGGMGLALSNRYFQYGSTPANIYLSIAQGRPNGMPAWGATLPPSVIWDLVTYIQEISQAPLEEWGTTVSAKSPSIEQVPAEFETTTTPWAHTEPFSYGQKPEGRNGIK